jgi:tetratricopeptide (TPR) repeat protein
MAAVVRAAPPALAQDSLQLLEPEAAALQRRSDAFRDRVDATIRGEHRRRQRRIDHTYESQIRAEEAAQRAARRRAIRELERFLARYPNEARHTPDALFRLAELRFEESYAAWLEASDRWEAAGEESAPPPDKDYGPTIELFRRLIEQWPGYRHLDGALYLLGYCLSETGRGEEAKRSWLALVCASRTTVASAEPYAGCEPIVPDSALLAEVWFRLGEHDFDDAATDALPAALDAYRRVLAWRDSPFVDEALYKLAWSHYRAEQYPEAIRRFTELLDLAESGGSELREEAVQYVALCIAEDDWDGDARPDRASSLERVQDPRLMPRIGPGPATSSCGSQR